MFFALAVYLCLLYLTYRIAVLKHIKHAEWVIVFVGLQPALFDISYACMTEMPTALVMMISYFFYCKQRHGWSMFAASLVILCRSEMYVFTGLMFLVYVWKRQWKILPLAFAGPALWIASTTIISGDSTTFFKEWSRFSSIGKFIPGAPLLHYITSLHATYGLMQLFFFAIGTYGIYKTKKWSDFGIPYAAICITIALHSLAAAEIFHWTGSIGELRYIATVGPFWGIISVYGLSEIFEKVRRSRIQFVLALGVLSVVVFQCTLETQPRRWPNYEKLLMHMTRSVRSEYPHIPILSNNCTVAYVLDVSPSGGIDFGPLTSQSIGKYSECLIVWDPFFSNSMFSQVALTKEMILKEPDIKVVDTYQYWSAEYLVLLKKK